MSILERRANMFKITATKSVTMTFYWGKKDKGRAISVKATPPDEESPQGIVTVYVERRITGEGMWRKYIQLPHAWAYRSRNKRMHVTGVPLGVGEALLLQEALNTVINEAKIVEETDPQPAT